MATTALAFGSFTAFAAAMGRMRFGTNDFLKNILKRSKDEGPIRHLGDEFNSMTRSAELANLRFAQSIVDSVPNASRREAITRWLDGDDSINLSRVEKEVAENVREYFDAIGQVAQHEGAIGRMLDNYVTHLWSPSTADEAARMASAFRKALPETTRFGEARSIPTIKEGERMGMKPKTLDIADIVPIYGNSVYKSIAAKRLLKGMKKIKTPHNTPAIISRTKAEKSGFIDHYRHVDSHHLAGQVVHQDIESAVRFFLQDLSYSKALRGAQALNYASKRMLVSTSFFHAMTLLESFAMAGKYKNFTPAIEQMKRGVAGDDIDQAVRSGLTFGLEDVGKWDSFYSAVDSFNRAMDETVPILGGTTRRITDINRKIDHIMWDKMHTGMKLTAYMADMEKMTRRFGHKLSQKQISDEVAQYVNDAFGGLDWWSISRNMKLAWAREASSSAFSPRGRQLMQMALFAPDWTISNIRILWGAVPGFGRRLFAPDKVTPKDILHTNYAMRGAMWWATVGNVLNLGYTGRPIWENDDPTMIDMGDGRRITFSKQFFEPFNWIEDPGKTGWNKLGTGVKFGIEQMLGYEYITPQGGPKMASMWEDPAQAAHDRLTHVTGKFNPIWIQNWADQGGITASGVSGAALSFFGHPRYGQQERAGTFDAGYFVPGVEPGRIRWRYRNTQNIVTD